MSNRLLPSDDPVAEQVLEWTIKRDAHDITQLMRWMETTDVRRDRQVLLNRGLDLIGGIHHARGRLDELR